MTLPMTKIKGAPDKSQVKPGMAYFADTGPFGTRCGTCVHRGYYREAERWNKKRERHELRRIHVTGCAMYHQLTGRHGPSVDQDWASCKYYEPAGPGGA